MPQATFRFLGELNDFLPPAQREQVIVAPLNGSTAVKHPIESLGVPHPEVELILANGQAVEFGYRVQADDAIEVHPVSTAGCFKGMSQLRPPLTPPLRFVLDTHLGQLATYLRLFGFDTLYRNDYDDAELAQISSDETRILLTRDRGLLKRKRVVYGHCVRLSDPRQQVVAVLRRYQLTAAVEPWQRLRCNGRLQPTSKAAVLDQLNQNPPVLRRLQRCDNCGQVYWQGSHHTKMQNFMEEVREVVLPHTLA